MLRISEGSTVPRGMEVVRVLDRNHLIVSASGQQLLSKGTKDGVWPVNPLWKLSPNTSLSRPGKSVYIVRIPDADCPAGPLQLSPLGRDGYFTAYATGKEIAQYLLPLDCVTYIGEESLTPTGESSIPDLNLTVNHIARLQQEVPALKGENTVLSIKDDKYDEYDIDLRGKHIPAANESNRVSIHATDMATLATGLGNSSANGRGVAPGARISSSDFRSLYPDDAGTLQAIGASAQNHSYGTEIENFYGALAREYDAQVYLHPSLVHLFSSGNQGLETPENGMYSGLPGYANITGNFKMSKNTITVGAIDTGHSRLPFSSRGPAHDGRIKPEVVAFSTIGTSNANALVAGITLLLQEQYREDHGGVFPPASLIKSLLINGADDTGAPGPDFGSGYGNVNALKSRNMLRDNRFITDRVYDSEVREYNIAIPEGAIAVKVTLCWTDPPGEPNSNIALVNDLDLTVSDGTSVYEPWVLDHSPDAQRLEQAATRGKDRINNTEQVLVPGTPGNNLTIKVVGHRVSGEGQDFSIAYSWDTENGFEWINPVEGHNFPYNGISSDFIRWKSTFNAPGRLEVSHDSGNTWQLLDNAVAPDRTFFSWDPYDKEGTALLRMTIDGQSFTSPPFVISYALNPGISLKCGETTEISWRSNPTAIAYDVFSLQNNTMTPITRVTDTTYIADNALSSSHFAIAPVFPDDVRGIRSRAVDISGDTVLCYWSSMYATNDEAAERILLFFSLESIYGLRKMEVFKIFPDGEERLLLSEPVNRKVFELTDDSPLQGANSYRAKLTLNDGSELYSETVSTIYLSNPPFLLFPNPVTTGGLNIYGKAFGNNDAVYFYLYTADGKFVSKEELISDRAYITLDGIPNGVYYYKIEVNGRKLKSGGLIFRNP